MSWLLRLFRKREMERRLDQELRFHLDQRASDLIRQGVDRAEARRRAALELGGVEQVKEECRDARGTRWLEDFVQDVRYALRTLRNRPGFAAVAMATLALGTGATTVMYSVVDGVLLKPLAYRDPQQLLRLWERTDWSTSLGDRWSFSRPNFEDVRRELRSADVIAWTFRRGLVTEPQPAQHQTAVEVPHEFFGFVGIRIAMGRDFLAEDDRPGARPAAIITEEYWRRHFGGSSSAIGARLDFDGTPYMVIGILPPGFLLEGYDQPIFIPSGLLAEPWYANRGRHGFPVWARMHRGATMRQVQAELAVIGTRLERQYQDTNKGRTFIAEPLHAPVDSSSMLWLLLGAVGLVLLIACANIASLLLARAVSRDRELAMRVALGAGRGRLARQCLTESLVLALAGGGLGVLLARFGIRPFLAYWPGELLRSEQVGLDSRVLAFAFGVSVFSGVLFGLAPALRAARKSLEPAMRAASRSVIGSQGLQGAFVAAEVAIAVVLLVSAGMLGRTMLRLSSLPPGIDVHHLLTARTGLAPATLENTDRTRAAWDAILERSRRIPGVEAIATVDTVPLREGSNSVTYRTRREPLPDDRGPELLATCVSPDYLQVMKIPLLAGRFLSERDRKGTEFVAVIDETLAGEAWPNEDPIGKHIWFGISDAPATVIGVVGHVRQWGAADDDQAQVRAQLYYAFAQVPDALVKRWSDLMSIAVRTSGDPLAMAEPLAREVRGQTGDQVIYEIHTMEDLARASLAQQRFLLLLFGIFAGLALLLASLGIYGVLAYLTGRRVTEIGVRMALGATAADVARMILRQSLRMTMIGIVAGAAGAFGAARVIERLVEGARPVDASTFGIAVAIFLLVAFCASFLPARRASRIDPMSALRRD